MNSKIGWIVIIIVALLIIFFGFSSDRDVVNEEGEVNEVESHFSNEDLVGVWESSEDSKFTREFTEDGLVTDKYEGEELATSVGTWQVVDNVSEEPVDLPEVGDQTVIRLVFDTETLYFAITPDSTNSNLNLTYLNGNGVLSFTRVE